jgi:hypothetical protein
VAGVEGLLDVLAGDLVNSKDAGACGVLSGEARDVIHERGRAVELRSFGTPTAGSYKDVRQA